VTGISATPHGGHCLNAGKGKLAEINVNVDWSDSVNSPSDQLVPDGRRPRQESHTPVGLVSERERFAEVAPVAMAPAEGVGGLKRSPRIFRIRTLLHALMAKPSPSFLLPPRLRLSG